MSLATYQESEVWPVHLLHFVFPTFQLYYLKEYTNKLPRNTPSPAPDEYEAMIAAAGKISRTMQKLKKLKKLQTSFLGGNPRLQKITANTHMNNVFSLSTLREYFTYGRTSHFAEQPGGSAALDKPSMLDSPLFKGE